GTSRCIRCRSWRARIARTASPGSFRPRNRDRTNLDSGRQHGDGMPTGRHLQGGPLMRKVQRSELLDYQTYGERRAQVQEKMFEVKRPRRVHLGEHLTFLFENHDTIWYQIQEMMRAEQLVKEDAIAHELETYNGLLGDNGVLSCSLLIEIDDRAVRAEKLRSWLPLPRHVYVELPDGKKVYAE